MTFEELERIAAARHDDPHRVLGPHPAEGGWVVRTFQPHAEEVTLESPGRSPVAMARVFPPGIFEAALPSGEPIAPYEIVVRRGDRRERFRDPYAFPPVLGDLDLHLFSEGNHDEIYRHLGAHVRTVAGATGTAFAVWAPNAARVSVVGDFNEWDGRRHMMRRRGPGVFELFIPGLAEGTIYKFEVLTEAGAALKADPYARAAELRPDTASRVTRSTYVWRDEDWLARRREQNPHRRPMAIYEVHLPSWRRAPGEGRGSPEGGGAPTTRWKTYLELADELVDYVVDLGFTHVELLPVMEHPFDGSWGYQLTGFYAPTSRLGEPDDFRAFVDRCHERGIGVLLDWVPAHFPKDAWALARFDGTALYEHHDPRRGEHKQWGTLNFHYGRHEVRNFLIGSALYWLDEFHVDGLRVDAVASMLYLDYGAEGGEWLPNEKGGRENLEAVALLRDLSDRVRERFPGVVLAAEESTTWPGVTQATYLGGLGFDLKWNMGWMHDTLDYFEFDPVFRAYHHQKITFGLMYAFSERFLLPLSHDEVVHLKHSLLSKMPGDRWQRMANLRCLFALMWAHPGKKLLFMGGEIGQPSEWDFSTELEWHVLGEPDHAAVQRLVRDLNRIYRDHPALFEIDDAPESFRWIDPNDAPQSVFSFIRFAATHEGRGAPKRGGAEAAKDEGDVAAKREVGEGDAVRDHVVVVANLTPVPRVGYRLGVPLLCAYDEILNTDATVYTGSGMGNMGSSSAESVASHGFEQSLVVTLPPLSCLYLVPRPTPPTAPTTLLPIRRAIG